MGSLSSTTHNSIIHSGLKGATELSSVSPILSKEYVLDFSNKNKAFGSLLSFHRNNTNITINDLATRVKIQKNISKCEKHQIIGEFIGLIKLSKNASDILTQKYLELKKSHKGKFHNATSLKQAYITDMLQEIIDSNYLVEPVIIEGKWCEIDTIQDIEYAKQIFK